MQVLRVSMVGVVQIMTEDLNADVLQDLWVIDVKLKVKRSSL